MSVSSLSWLFGVMEKYLGQCRSAPISLGLGFPAKQKESLGRRSQQKPLGLQVLGISWPTISLV